MLPRQLDPRYHTTTRLPSSALLISRQILAHHSSEEPQYTSDFKMKPALFLAALAPAVLAESQLRARDLTPDLAHRSPAASIPENAIAREQHLPMAEPDQSTILKLGARHVVQARSEGSLGQTPWIGMAIGLTCTALAAVMLG